MTREQLNKHWDLIDAYKNGAEIEFKDAGGDWKIIDEPVWSYYTEYRVKPSASEYIPFDFSDAEDLIGRLVKVKNGGSIYIITSCSILNVGLGSTQEYYSSLFGKCTFLDGSPCGKLKQ